VVEGARGEVRSACVLSRVVLVFPRRSYYHACQRPTENAGGAGGWRAGRATGRALLEHARLASFFPRRRTRRGQFVRGAAPRPAGLDGTAPGAAGGASPQLRV